MERVAMPTMRPTIAPTAIGGIKTPEGTWGMGGRDVTGGVTGRRGGISTTVNYCTLMPNVNTVMTIMKRVEMVRRP
jgi:hypothetical protein